MTNQERTIPWSWPGAFVGSIGTIVGFSVGFTASDWQLWVIVGACIASAFAGGRIARSLQ